MNPILQERISKFRKSKRAYWSLLVLVSLFLLSLPAELICNDKPYTVSYKGKRYWPIFNDYAKRDFGIDSDLPITDYRSFLAGLAGPGAGGAPGGGRREANDLLYQLYGDDHEPLDIEAYIRERARESPASSGWSDDELIYQLYGDDNERVDIEALAARQDAGEDVYARIPESGSEREDARKFAAVSALWPPIRYNAKTKNAHYTTERGHLIGPFSYVSDVTGDTVHGAIKDGHLLGTDEQGRDVFARLLYGFRVSLIFGFGLALSGTMIGCLLGGLQGYFGGLTDLLGQRATEIWGSMPRLFLLIILSSFLANQRQLTDMEHFGLLFGILNLTAWMGMASHMRAQFLRARNLDYVKAAKALGQGNLRIMSKHILPNSLVPIVTFVPFAITGGITALVSLDFLGFGVKYPAPSLGNMLSQGQSTLKWWIILPTVLVLAVTLILLTFVGEGVRNAFDPRKKN